MNSVLTQDEYYTACEKKIQELVGHKKIINLYNSDPTGYAILYTLLKNYHIEFVSLPSYSYDLSSCLTLFSNITPIPIPDDFLPYDVDSVAGFNPNRIDGWWKDCRVGKFSSNYHIFSNGLTSSIGRFCAINPAARVVPNHPTKFVSTQGFTSSDPRLFQFSITPEQILQWNEKYDDSQNEPGSVFMHKGSLYKNPLVTVGNDVWIGVNSRIMPGVHIGDGAIIGAGAIVTKDVPPYAIVGGVPASIIKYRFPQDIIDAMLRIQWWNWEMKKIEENLELFYQPIKFALKFDTK